jgi:hypothetical protein
MSSTYYIDFASGSDANNGTSKTTPWKHHPYMAGWTGPYSHNAGDHFIFKGGITWPNACFRMNITNGGTSDAIRDYYGVDSTWYTGGNWSRPIYDMQGSQTATYNQVMNVLASYVTFDNLEITNFYWTGAQAWAHAQMIQYCSGTYLTFKNIYIHSWTHGTTANGTADDLKCFCGGTSAPYNPGSIIEYCEFNGLPSGSDGGMAAYAGCAEFCYNKVHDMANGPVLSGDGSVANWKIHDNVIYNINISFDPTMHENGIETVGSGAQIYNNLVYNINTGTNNTVLIYVACGQGSAATTDLVYNNVVYGCQIGGIPLQIDMENPYHLTSTLKVLNNTFIPTGAFTSSIRFVDKGNGQLGKAIIQNNHLISDASVSISGNSLVNSYTADHNSIQTVSAATANGFSSANNYAPTAGTCSTVDAGTSESSIFLTDILGVSRPQGSAWDIGAYEYVTNLNPPVITSQPSNLTKNVGQQATFAIAATGTGTLTYQWNKFSINIPGATNNSFTTSALVLGDNGNIYTCLVKDNNGIILSRSATLAVYQTGIPIISSLVPSSGNYVGGYNVHLSSSNVLTSGGKPTLTVGPKNITSFSSTENSVDFSMPFGTVGQTNVILTNYQGGKDTTVFTRDSSFYFASVSPVSSTNGTIISYHGGGFKPNRGAGTISMDSVYIITSWSDTLIQAKLNVNRVLNIIKNSAGSKDTIAGSILGGTLTY